MLLSTHRPRSWRNLCAFRRVRR